MAMTTHNLMLWCDEWDTNSSDDMTQDGMIYLNDGQTICIELVYAHGTNPHIGNGNGTHIATEHQSQWQFSNKKYNNELQWISIELNRKIFQ